MSHMSCCLKGKVKYFEALTNLKNVLGNEGFNDVALRYLGGMWVMLMFKSLEEKEKFKSGVGVGSWFSKIISTTHEFIVDGRVTWVEIEGGPDVQGDDESESEFDNDEVEQKVNLVDGDDESLNAEDINEVRETIFEDRKENIMGAEASPDNHEIHSEDPFNIYSLLAKKKWENTLDHSLAQKAKKDWVKELCVANKVTFLTLQETKMESIELFDVKRCWKNFTFDYVHSNLVEGTCNTLLIISVYAPQELSEKKMLWDYIGHVIDSWKGDVIIMGDFNEVRYKSERFGSNFNVHGANAFNSLIVKASLEEVPLRGCTFTRCHKSTSKMSKLDRFLISESLSSSCPNISAITLDRFLSDHRPILLRESSFDYDPTPFRFFHYWIEMDGFEKMVSDTWRESLDVGPNHMINLMNKLKYLKKKIRTWNGM
nr:RNA-directed DNA polymerase, eukaryota [Tanacetum cinerariifolium]